MLKYAFLRWKPPAEPFADALAMRLWQRYRCAVCSRKPYEIGEGLQLDHDHTTGLARGYLCRDCNRNESGWFWKRPNPFLDWQTGVTPAGRFGLVHLYHSAVNGPIFQGPTDGYVDAVFSWDGIKPGYRLQCIEVSDSERYRALGYVLAGVRAVHEGRRLEHDRPTGWQ